MRGIRFGPLVVATLVVVLALYGGFAVGRGRILLGGATFAAAFAGGYVLVRRYARAAAQRQARARERERAFVEQVRRR